MSFEKYFPKAIFESVKTLSQMACRYDFPNKLFMCDMALWGVVHARAFYATAHMSPVSRVKDDRCAPFAACAWRQSPRALGCCCARFIKLASPASSCSRISTSHGTLSVFLCVSASALLLRSRLCCALVSARLRLQPLRLSLIAFDLFNNLLASQIC